MKTTQIKKLTRLTVAVVVFAGGAGLAVASENTTAKRIVAQEIPLNASNNATQTATVWTPRAVSRGAGEAAPVRNDTARVVELHAPNSPTRSVTIWTRSTEDK
jgi:hypothetical protein